MISTNECDPPDEVVRSHRPELGAPMSQFQLGTSANTLLCALSQNDRALLDPHLEPVKLDRRAVLASSDRPIEYVYFLQTGIASITAPSNESGQTEIGIIGRDGMSGATLLLAGDRSPHETHILVAPAQARRITADRFTATVEVSATLRRWMLRYVQTLVTQVAQCAVANARHQIEARLARWLLMCHDRADGDEIAVTHELMSMTIAAQRSGVTLALHILEGAGTIRSTRGLVVIRNRAKLEKLAGDAYGVAEAEYRRLIGPLGPLSVDPTLGHGRGGVCGASPWQEFVDPALRMYLNGPGDGGGQVC
jgi:CRP-like cAMP-binding protein